MGRWLAAVGLVAIGAACGGLPALPSKGGPKWYELTSDHFIVWTDVSLDDARHVMRELEEFRAALVAFALKSFEDPIGGRGRVIVVRDWDEWEDFEHGSRVHVLGLTWRANRSPMFQPVLLFPYEVPRNLQTTVQHHELSHLVLHQFIKDQPMWFAEGMATYFETLTMDPKTREVTVGKMPADMGRRMVTMGVASVDKILAATTDEPPLYTTGYFLVSYLLTRRAEEFATYQRVLKQLPRGAQRKAWDRVFPDLHGQQADDALTEFFQHGHLLTTRFHLPPRDELKLEERVLGDGEVLIARAMLYMTLSGAKDEAKQAVQAALREAPDQPLASALSFFLGQERDVAAMRAVVAAHPDDFLGYFWLAKALGNDPEVKELIGKACALAAQNRAVDLPEELCTQAPAAAP